MGPVMIKYGKGGGCMRDFPVFTTENGVGSLVLKEIPYNGTAYITIYSSSFPTDFLKECVDFCRAVGAERIYGTGHACLEEYPLFTSVIQMSAARDCLGETDACLFPVTEKSIKQWREIYNEKMKNVHNAAYMSERAAEELLSCGGGYFIHREQTLLGIGIAREDCIACIASVTPGSGRQIIQALAHALMCDCVKLEVASTNYRAVRLYEYMGFIKTTERSKWYKII